ncbi:putative serine/threonine protein kinase [Blattamonas nauphoetae]|uniref:Serine/threonine protein kinase n=1 Tax=Blattamonas nauphoetae TaxID=2049346 RepID=A0ABQ9XKT1_9EUKA|nr:putative serine/threonine protein kinase [Blattamonas nauphoetae]
MGNTPSQEVLSTPSVATSPEPTPVSSPQVSQMTEASDILKLEDMMISEMVNPPSEMELDYLGFVEDLLLSFERKIPQGLLYTTRLAKVKSQSGQKLLNQYSMEGFLGKGSYGKVNKCVDVNTGAVYAIKSFNRAQIEKKKLNQPCILEQIIKEIAIMSSLRHEHIVNLVEVINDPTAKKLYLVVDYGDYGSLDKANIDCSTKEGLDELRQYMRDIIEALHYIHSNFIVHRDIKPENILIYQGRDEHGNPAKRAKLADFGAAEFLHPNRVQNSNVFGSRSSKMTLNSGTHTPSNRSHTNTLSNNSPNILDSRTTPHSLTGSNTSLVSSVSQPHIEITTHLLTGLQGTPTFFSPELITARTHPLINAVAPFPVDVWAAGVTFFFLTFQKVPFSGSTELELFHSICTETPPEISSDPPKPPTYSPTASTPHNSVDDDKEQLVDVIRRCLNKNPEDRVHVVELMCHPFVTHNFSQLLLPPHIQDVLNGAREEIRQEYSIHKHLSHSRAPIPHSTPPSNPASNHTSPSALQLHSPHQDKRTNAHSRCSSLTQSISTLLDDIDTPHTPVNASFTSETIKPPDEGTSGGMDLTEEHTTLLHLNMPRQEASPPDNASSEPGDSYSDRDPDDVRNHPRLCCKHTTVYSLNISRFYCDTLFSTVLSRLCPFHSAGDTLQRNHGSTPVSSPNVKVNNANTPHIIIHSISPHQARTFYQRVCTFYRMDYNKERDNVYLAEAYTVEKRKKRKKRQTHDSDGNSSNTSDLPPRADFRNRRRSIGSRNRNGGRRRSIGENLHHHHSTDLHNELKQGDPQFNSSTQIDAEGSLSNRSISLSARKRDDTFLDFIADKRLINDQFDTLAKERNVETGSSFQVDISSMFAASMGDEWGHKFGMDRRARQERRRKEKRNNRNSDEEFEPITTNPRRSSRKPRQSNSSNNSSNEEDSSKPSLPEVTKEPPTPGGHTAIAPGKQFRKSRSTYDKESRSDPWSEFATTEENEEEEVNPGNLNIQWLTPSRSNSHRTDDSDTTFVFTQHKSFGSNHSLVRRHSTKTGVSRKSTLPRIYEEDETKKDEDIKNRPRSGSEFSTIKVESPSSQNPTTHHMTKLHMQDCPGTAEEKVDDFHLSIPGSTNVPSPPHIISLSIEKTAPITPSIPSPKLLPPQMVGNRPSPLKPPNLLIPQAGSPMSNLSLPRTPLTRLFTTLETKKELKKEEENRRLKEKGEKENERRARINEFHQEVFGDIAERKRREKENRENMSSAPPPDEDNENGSNYDYFFDGVVETDRMLLDTDRGDDAFFDFVAPSPFNLVEVPTGEGSGTFEPSHDGQDAVGFLDSDGTEDEEEEADDEAESEDDSKADLQTPRKSVEEAEKQEFPRTETPPKRGCCCDSDSTVSEHELPRDPTNRFVQEIGTLFYQSSYKRIYRAYDMDTGNEVTWCETQLLDVDDQGLEEIHQGMVKLQGVRHPFLISYLSHWFDRDKSVLSVIREYMHGVTMKSFIETRGIPRLPIVLRWVHQILTCLNDLHTSTPPLKYLGLQSDNVYIQTSVGSVKLSPIRLDVITKYLPPHIQIIHPAYRAPEFRTPQCSTATDIFSFGMCLIFLLTGTEPYAEITDPMEIRTHIKQGIPPKNLSEIQSPDVLSVIKQCINPNPMHRPTAATLLQNPSILISSPSHETDDSQTCPNFPMTLDSPTPSNPGQGSHRHAEPLKNVFLRHHITPGDDLTHLYVMLSDQEFMNFIDRCAVEGTIPEGPMPRNQDVDSSREISISPEPHHHPPSALITEENPESPSSSPATTSNYLSSTQPSLASSNQSELAVSILPFGNSPQVVSDFLSQLRKVFRAYQRVKRIDIDYDITITNTRNAPPHFVAELEKLRNTLTTSFTDYLLPLRQNAVFMQNLKHASDLALINPKKRPLRQSRSQRQLQQHSPRHMPQKDKEAKANSSLSESTGKKNRPLRKREKSARELNMLLEALKQTVNTQQLSSAINQTISNLEKKKTPTLRSHLSRGKKKKDIGEGDDHEPTRRVSRRKTRHETSSPFSSSSLSEKDNAFEPSIEANLHQVTEQAQAASHSPLSSPHTAMAIRLINIKHKYLTPTIPPDSPATLLVLASANLDEPDSGHHFYRHRGYRHTPSLTDLSSSRFMSYSPSTPLITSYASPIGRKVSTNNLSSIVSISPSPVHTHSLPSVLGLLQSTQSSITQSVQALYSSIMPFISNFLEDAGKDEDWYLSFVDETARIVEDILEQRNHSLKTTLANGGILSPHDNDLGDNESSSP